MLDSELMLFSKYKNLFFLKRIEHVIVVQSLSRIWLFVTPWTAAHQATLSFTISQSLLKLMSIELVMPSNHLTLCWPLLLLPSVLPSIRVFSTESVLHIKWPKYWSFSFSINPSNEYSGLICFRIDLLDLLAVQGTLKNLLHQFLWLLSPDIPRVLESESQDPWTKTIYEIQEGGDMGVPMADSCWCMTENHKIL